MERWTRVVLRFRWPILAGWVVVLLAGGFAFTHLSSLLSNEFSVSGTDSERARTILERHFGDRSDGAFTVVFRLRDGVDRAAYVRLQRDVDRAARVVPDSTARQLVPAARNIVYGDIVSTLSLAKAKGYTDDLYRALPHGGGVQSYVTGQAAIQHDLDPIFSKDLRKGEMIALPIAVLVLLAVFGLSVAVTMPFIFAACTVMATLGGVYLYAHFLTTATYVTNLVFLIGLGIAIDYSLLVVYRFREELRRPGGSRSSRNRCGASTCSSTRSGRGRSRRHRWWWIRAAWAAYGRPRCRRRSRGSPHPCAPIMRPPRFGSPTDRLMSTRPAATKRWSWPAVTSTATRPRRASSTGYAGGSYRRPASPAASLCSRAAGRLRASISSTRPTATSRGSSPGFS